jgi:hypothetical protein
MVKSWCTESYTKRSTQRTHGTDLYGDNTAPVIPSSEGTGEDWKGSAAFGISPWNVQQAGGVLCTAYHPLPCPCWLLHKGKAALCVHFLLDRYSAAKDKHRLHAEIKIHYRWMGCETVNCKDKYEYYGWIVGVYASCRRSEIWILAQVLAQSLMCMWFCHSMGGNVDALK